MFYRLNDDLDRTKSGNISIFIFALSALVCALSIDKQSFWMDELGTRSHAQVDSLSAWFSGFLKISHTDGQLPLYHFSVFLWSRFAGSSEIGLRSLNVFWLMISISVIIFVNTTDIRTRLFWIILLLANCFVVAYLNEARPYMMLICGSVFLISALAMADQVKSSGQFTDIGGLTTLFFAGSLLSFGASPVASPFIVAIAVGIIAMIGPGGLRQIPRIGTWRMIFCLLCTLSALGIAGLILYSIGQGARPSLANPTNPSTVAFGFLELGGATGLLPGRDVLRVMGASAIKPWQWVALAGLCASWATGLYAAWKGPNRRLVAWLTGITALSVACVVLAGLVIGFRVVGRHFAFAVPPLTLIFVLGALSASIRIAWAAFALPFLLIVSSIIFRLDHQLWRDDTRSAASVAKVALQHGRTVWWVGLDLVPDYFHIKMQTISKAGKPSDAVLAALNGENWPSYVDRLPLPDAIIIERPEVANRDLFFTHYAERAGLTISRNMRGYLALIRPEPNSRHDEHP